MYSLIISNKAVKQSSKIPKPIKEKVDERIKKLSDNPFPPDCEKLKSSKSSYRIRQGEYRIIYTVDEINIRVLVSAIGHRKDVYRDL